MQPTPKGSAPQFATAGAWLKNARQQRGLHIAALAVMLKVPQAKLEALEADRFDLLPDATFARALATAVCRALKVDAAAVLALLPRTHEQGFDVRPGLNQPFRERGGGSVMDDGMLAVLKRPAVWGLALLLVVAAAITWVPAGWLPSRGEAASAPAFPASAPASVAASGPQMQFVPAPEAASSPASAEPAGPVVAASAPAVLASAPLQVRDVPAPAAVSGPLLRLTATADSWVQVVDAQGQVLISRVLRQGEQQEYSGAAPYKVRVGNVSGTRLEWRGSAFDLHDRASNNVARLELK